MTNHDKKTDRHDRAVDLRDVSAWFCAWWFSAVVFAYQMRPKEKVLDGINLTINGGSTVRFDI